MPVRLRLRRMGKKRQPVYQVVAADSRVPRDGKFLEAIGLYNPKTSPHTLEINVDLALKWLQDGAQPTETVRSLLSQSGVLYKKELLKKGLSADAVATELEQWKANKAAAKGKITRKEKKAQAQKQQSTAEATGAASETSAPAEAN